VRRNSSSSFDPGVDVVDPAGEQVANLSARRSVMTALLPGQQLLDVLARMMRSTRPSPINHQP
jgi:hypothetical protein